MKKIFITVWKFHTIYLWLLPASILLFMFLLKPSVETVILSFYKQVKFSEASVKNSVIEALSQSENAGNTVDEYSLFKECIRWREALALIEKRYGIAIRDGEIAATMNVRQLVELALVKGYAQLQTKGSRREFAGLKNFAAMFSDGYTLTALRNNVLWLFMFTLATVGIGLLMSMLIERVRWSAPAKTLLFMPMAISYVAAGVIWAFMYDKDVDTGTVNAFIHMLDKVLSFSSGNGFSSTYSGMAFLSREGTVNFALIAASVWMWSGYCMVIFTTAIRAIPREIKEAAMIDGTNVFRLFFGIEVPMIMPTITVVATTMVINVLKVFDIVYATTQGGPAGASEVLANRIYRVSFNERNFEYASAMAVTLFILIIPVMIINVRKFAKE